MGANCTHHDVWNMHKSISKITAVSLKFSWGVWGRWSCHTLHSSLPFLRKPLGFSRHIPSPLTLTTLPLLFYFIFLKASLKHKAKQNRWLVKAITTFWLSARSRGALILPPKAPQLHEAGRAGPRRPMDGLLQIQALNPYLLTLGTVLFLL